MPAQKPEQQRGEISYVRLRSCFFVFAATKENNFHRCGKWNRKYSEIKRNRYTFRPVFRMDGNTETKVPHRVSLEQWCFAIQAGKISRSVRSIPCRLDRISCNSDGEKALRSVWVHTKYLVSFGPYAVQFGLGKSVWIGSGACGETLGRLRCKSFPDRTRSGPVLAYAPPRPHPCIPYWTEFFSRKSAFRSVVCFGAGPARTCSCRKMAVRNTFDMHRQEAGVRMDFPDPFACERRYEKSVVTESYNA